MNVLVWKDVGSKKISLICPLVSYNNVWNIISLYINPNELSDGQNLQAGALLATLRKTRLGLEGQHSVLEQAIRQQQNGYDQRNSFRGSRTRQGPGSFNQGSNSYQSSRSSSSSSSSSSSGSSYRSSYSSSSSSSRKNSYDNSYFEQNQVGGGGYGGNRGSDYDDYYDEGPKAGRG